MCAQPFQNEKCTSRRVEGLLYLVEFCEFIVIKKMKGCSVTGEFGMIVHENLPTGRSR
jgi:hypothetical protein